MKQVTVWNDSYFGGVFLTAYWGDERPGIKSLLLLNMGVCTLPINLQNSVPFVLSSENILKGFHWHLPSGIPEASFPGVTIHWIFSLAGLSLRRTLINVCFMLSNWIKSIVRPMQGGARRLVGNRPEGYIGSFYFCGWR